MDTPANTTTSKLINGGTGVDTDMVQLEPFLHQVGGHHSMLRYDELTLCKPLIPREQHFYENVPEEMKQFIPEYRGVIEVAFKEDNDGYINLVAISPHKKRSSKSHDRHGSHNDDTSNEQKISVNRKRTSTKTSQSTRVRMRRTGSLEGVDTSPAEEEDETVAESHNPWSLRCHKEQLVRMRKKSKGADSHKFILLENLACKFQYPCILDLKMGTRQHGDDASEQKKKSQMAKCEASTSAKLGVRVCGMQVYQQDSGHYICRNKYYGRSLSDDGFKHALRQFLHNGYKLRRDLIAQILPRLHELYRAVEGQQTFRFYSSSLLIMYEGSKNCSPPLSPQKTLSSSTLPNGQDTECSNRTTVWQQHSSSRMPVGPFTSLQHTADPTDGNNSSSFIDATGFARRTVDVKMIDFAHTTHAGFQSDEETVHVGPDKGYLFGLKNAIKILQDILEDNEA